MAISDRVTFPGSQASALAARLDRPVGEPRAYALFAHCFSCSKDIFAASRISQGLTDHGFAVLRFDFTGLGQSDGDFANTNFSSNVEDLLRAVDFLRTQHQAPSVMIGHSLGGAATLMAATQVPEARAVVTVGAPADTGHVVHNFIEHVPEIEAKGEAQVQLGGRPFTIRRQFLDDLKAHRVTDAVAGLHKALLVMHAPLDATVGIDNATDLFIKAKHPKSFVSLDTADHLLTAKADARYAADVIAAWSARFLGTGAVAEPVQTGEREVLVTETAPGPYTARIIARRHHQIGDQPKASGGQDAGPAPYDYLANALALCTIQTIRVYAQRKTLTLGPVSARVRYDKRHIDDCEDCIDGKGMKILHFDVELVLDGVVDEAVRSKLLEIAGKCPVHQTLAHHHAPVTIRLAD
ncbi:MAG: alpha/beta fold hydrolase [Alphaproteobacteria bacterium]